MSHVHARDPFCPQIFSATICRDSDSANPSDKGHFRTFRTAQLYVALAQGRRLCRMHHVRRGTDCYAGVAFKQTWIEE
jgi:hypothetical protein